MNRVVHPPPRRPADVDNDLTGYRFGPRMLYLRRTLEPYAAQIADGLNSPRLRGPSEGNRRSAFRLLIPGAPEIVARQSRRGGLMRWFTADLYCGLRPRPLNELRLALEARRRGIPTTEPLGAMVHWLAPVLYRGLFLTRAVEGMTLWELIRTDDDPHVRSHVLEQARRAIETMHDRGLFHADLNLHNLFVTRADEDFAVIILDLDKARLYDAPLSAALRRRNHQRLVRSARKLDPARLHFDSRAIELLGNTAPARK